MTLRTSLFSLYTLVFLMLSACQEKAPNEAPAEVASSDTQITVIQFHNEHRCMTCNKIETLTKTTLEDYPDISFTLINVDEASNEAMAEAFEAYGTSLYLHNPTSDAKKDLTDFAFMNAMNEADFIAGLKKEIESFLK